MIWDLRAKKAQGNILGANISGDSLDIKGDSILAGSYRNKDQLQVFSLSMQKLEQLIDWDVKERSDDIYVYSC